MARSLWSGSLSFGFGERARGALKAPCATAACTSAMLHQPDGSPIETRRVCTQEEREVPWAEIVKGYEMQDGSWVLLSDEDLAAAAPRKSHMIDIEVSSRSGRSILMYLHRPYLLIPKDEGAARAYALLGEAMRESGKVALGRFVMRAQEHLVDIRDPREAVHAHHDALPRRSAIKR